MAEKYRKKPVVVEAIQAPTERDSIEEYLDACIALAAWCGGISYMMVNEGERAYRGADLLGPHILIQTLEGAMAALPGDWIIKGVKGEFYPCKPDIFEATYEAVTDDGIDPTDWDDIVYGGD